MRTTTYLLLTTCLAAALPLLGCGGGSSNTPAPVTESISLQSEPTQDGRVSITGVVDFTTGITNVYTGDRGGDIFPTYQSRQLYAFNLIGIPLDARIVSATLRLYQARVVGNPYSDLGDVVVDHVDYMGAPGIDSYDDQTLARNLGAISSSPDEGYKMLDVTAQVASNFADGDAWSQFRLRFWHTGISIFDAENDYANFIDGENDDFIVDAPPYLDIVYEP